MDKSLGDEEYAKLVDNLKADDALRTEFLRCCLEEFGLTVNGGSDTIPSLSKLHLSSIMPSDVQRLIDGMQGIISSEGEGKPQLIVGENDTFVLDKQQPQQGSQRQYSPTMGIDDSSPDSMALIDLNKVPKHLRYYPDSHPDPRDTPFFGLSRFYDALKSARTQTSISHTTFGSYIMYGEVVTSTNTLLDKYVHFIKTFIVQTHIGSSISSNIRI